jgi:uncharacterized protein YndB with AHSA1/START domain
VEGPEAARDAHIAGRAGGRRAQALRRAGEGQGLTHVVVEATARSDAPRDVVWRVLADGRRWSEWGEWQTTEYEREGDPAPDGVGAIRRFTRRPVTSREEVVLFEPPSRFAYTLLSGLPLRDYRADVTLTDSGGGGTNIHWESKFDVKVPGTAFLFRPFIRWVIADVAKTLAAAAEQRADKPPRRFAR